jgi:hypothetical protein
VVAVELEKEINRRNKDLEVKMRLKDLFKFLLILEKLEIRKMNHYFQKWTSNLKIGFSDKLATIKEIDVLHRDKVRFSSSIFV